MSSRSSRTERERDRDRETRHSHHGHSHSDRSQDHSHSSSAFDSSTSDDFDDGSRGSSESNIRISRLARSMARLDSEESFMKACGQIEDLIQRSVDNKRYVVRSFHCLTIPFSEALQGLTGVLWRETGIAKYSELLFQILNAMENQFNRMWQWLIEFIDRKGRNYRSFEHTSTAQDILLTMIPRLNHAQNDALIICIQEVIDHAPNADMFKIYCSLHVNCLLPYRKEKEAHFQELADIVIGWMIDVENADPSIIPLFCTEALKEMEPYFTRDSMFTMSLLAQVLEDIEDSSNLDGGNAHDKIIKVTRLLRAYSTLLNVCQDMEREYLLNSTERLISCANQCLNFKESTEADANVAQLRYELLCGMNEFISVCRGIDGTSIRYFLKEELELFTVNNGWKGFPMLVLNDFFLALSSWIETVVALHQQDEEVERIFNATMKFLDLIHSSLSLTHLQKVLRIIQGLLRTRNVVVLQCVYEWVIGKLTSITLNENNGYAMQDVDKKLFVLACLSDIATNKSGSILSLWALTPPIFDVLMGMMEGCDVDRVCQLELLRAHCSAHSYFVSSIALSRNYSADSPCTRFLNELMKFWTERMFRQKLTPQVELWMFSWISDFIRSSSHYATLLLEIEPTFYKTMIRQLVERPGLRAPLCKLLNWMTCDIFYQKSEYIVVIIRDTCIMMLLKETREHIRDMYADLLQRIPFLLLIEPELQDSSFDFNDEDGTTHSVANVPPPPFTLPDFHNFLYDLFVSDKNDLSPGICDGQISTAIKGAVEFLIQSKLKTTLGRPIDFFFHVQSMLKRYRGARVASQMKLPSWKLAFVYELERRLTCCIYESSFVSSGISEAVRSFYLTNKTPCIEWLKRMRADLAELSFAAKNYPATYYFATSSGDELKARYALLELEDLEGLAGLNEMAGYYYIKGEFEKVQNLLKNDELDIVKEVIMKRTESILRVACNDLEKWENADGTPEASLDFILQIPSNSRTFLKVQLDGIYENKRYPVDMHGRLDIISQYGILDMVKVRRLVKLMPNVLPDQRLNLDCIIVNRMIDLGNVTFVREWLTRHDWMDVEGKMNSNARAKIEYFIILAEILFNESQWEQSAKIYISLLNLFETEGDQLATDFMSHVMLKFIKKLSTCEELCEGAMMHRATLSGFDTNTTLVESILDKAVEISPLSVEVWFAFADFSYKRAITEETHYRKDAFKTNASHCYDRVIYLESKSKQTKMSLLAMTRLIKLHKDGHRLEPEKIITNEKWLTLLPELAHIEEFRAHLIKRFPEQAMFLVATYGKPQKFLRFAHRHGVFDPTAYVFTEASEERFQGVCQNNWCEFPSEHFDGGISEQPAKEQSQATKEFLALIPGNVSLVIQEMGRIGTSREEIWSWSVQRIGNDWIKRLAFLRKDLAREFNVIKIKAYIAPIWTYLAELWKETKDCESPAELAFVCRNGESIMLFLDRLSNCTTCDELEEIMNVLLKYVSNFDSSSGSKLAISNLSPQLSNFDFDKGSLISLPGFRPGVTVASIHSQVTCLATKTKPKRLMFRGSDGKKYEYLVKGNENLNIDSRIMQLLKATESFVEFPTRSYSVTPLGDRGGLIQIVEGAMPLFTMYKKYLARNNCSERPSEMFWRRLEAAGASDRSNNQALLTVFEELLEDTCPDLISRELFLCAEDTSGWYNSVRTFTRDCAVGSGIGYIAGVGDRHLDNILLIPGKGHLVHVDFSILFGKGASLRIPEKVPFRMTQNFAAALQYPGLPGPFQAHLDRIMHQFKDNEEIVEFCMESIAFAYQLEENLPIDPTILLSVELRSAVTLLQLRAGDISNFMQLVMRDVLDTCADTRVPMNAWTTRLDTLSVLDRITKKIYRWRRLLANIDPLIQFIATNAEPVGKLAVFTELVRNEWTPNVMHFWSHTNVQQVANLTAVFSQKFDFTETTLQILLHNVPPPDEIIQPKASSFDNSNCQKVDQRKINNLMTSVNQRISSISSTTAADTISLALNKDNLAQMYEGWTAWV